MSKTEVGFHFLSDLFLSLHIPVVVPAPSAC